MSLQPEHPVNPPRDSLQNSEGSSAFAPCFFNCLAAISNRFLFATLIAFASRCRLAPPSDFVPGFGSVPPG